MPAPYNMSLITEVNSTIDIVQAINVMTNHWFGILFAIAIFAIILLYISFYNFGVAFVAAAFLSSIFTGFLYYLELVPILVLIISIIMGFIGVLVLYIYYE